MAPLNRFIKSHGLGNDYIVLDSSDINFTLDILAIKKICDVHYGIGSDGILLKVPSSKAEFGLKIYNPDGSEAEKSGNGLRIFCKYLYDYGHTKSRQFTIETLGGIVKADIIELKDNKAFIITIDMGCATFESKKIPVNVSSPECLGHTMKVQDKTYSINCVSVGNPHCVVIKEKLDVDEIMKYGTFIENNMTLFPNRINVQFAKVISPSEVEILIWERGAGFTYASGSSSCAVACVTKKLGLTGGNVSLKMPGGIIKVTIDDQYNIRMTAEVRQIAEGILHPELIADIKKST